MRRGFERKRGFTLIEVVVSASLMSVFFLAMAGTFTSNFMAVEKARNLTNAASFLETTMENLHGQGYDQLLAMNGDVFYNGNGPGDSLFSAQLTVSPVSIGLVKVKLVLRELRTGREITRIVTYRSKR